MLDDHTLNRMNKLAFTVFLPLSLYYNIYTAEIGDLFDVRLLLYSFVTQVAVLVISLAVALLTEQGPKRVGALSHGIFHTNYVIFATLIGTALLGEGNIGMISLLIAIIVPIQNFFSVILLEYFRGKGGIHPLKTMIQVIKNPYVFAALAGFLTQLSGLEFPGVLSNYIRDLGRCGAPIALIVMGGLLNFASIKDNMKAILVGCTTKLFLIPLIFIPITIKMGFVGPAFVGLMCIFIGPSATTSFNLASMMDSDADLAAQLVVFTSIFSLFTIFGWIYALTSLGVL